MGDKAKKAAKIKAAPKAKAVPKAKAAKKTEEKKIKFKYVFNEDYNPTYVNGAYGGLSPTGEIVANFYLERSPLPKVVSHSIDAEGMLSEETVSDPVDVGETVIRYVSNGIIINYNTAIIIRDWLTKLIGQFESQYKSIDSTPSISSTALTSSSLNKLEK